MNDFKVSLWYMFMLLIIIGVFEINANVGLIVTGIIGSLHIIYYAE